MSATTVREELLTYEKMVLELMPKRATEEERTASGIIWHAIRLAHYAEQRLEFEVHRPLGWSWTGFRIMVNTFALGQTTPGQLADVLGITRPSTTHSLNKLERDGYIKRVHSTANRNRVDVTLTDKGRTAVREAVPAQNALEREIVAGIARDERHELENLLHALLVSLQSLNEPLTSND